MAVARARLDDGNFRALDAMTNKASSAARNEHIDNAVKLHEGIGRRAIGGIDEGNAVGGQACGNDRFAQRGNDCRIGMERLRAAAQHACIARLQANARGIGRDVRARLIHHGDNAQRHAYARKVDTAFQFAVLEHTAQRVGQIGERFKGIGHGIDAVFVQKEPIEQARRHVGGFASFHIDFITRENVGHIAPKRSGHGEKHLVANLFRSAPHRAGSRLRAKRDITN